ncbi:MAG TPA: ectoine hydroxylase [Gammaproteobacteria bacterium]|nr:ectoine hydroxylase [Gammaproteobacteria bacterium]
MDQNKDLYPSRTQSKTPMLPRLDPVVYADAQARGNGPLTGEQLDAFERDGFLFFPGFFSTNEISACIEELQRLSADPAVRASNSTILEPGSNEVRSIFAIHEISPHFRRLAHDPRIRDRARQLLGSDVYIHQSRINYKPGFKGKGFNWHSDFETWHAEDGMPRMRAVSCSIVLTDNNEFNGPLMLIPGSHKYFIPCVGETPDDNYQTSLKDQQIGVPDEESIASLAAAGGIKAPKGPAGSMLLFDCNTLHGSNANMSPYPRSNVFYVFNSVENRLQHPFAAKRPRPAFLATREK